MFFSNLSAVVRAVRQTSFELEVLKVIKAEASGDASVVAGAAAAAAVGSVTDAPVAVVVAVDDEEYLLPFELIDKANIVPGF